MLCKCEKRNPGRFKLYDPRFLKFSCIYHDFFVFFMRFLLDFGVILYMKNELYLEKTSECYLNICETVIDRKNVLFLDCVCVSKKVLDDEHDFKHTNGYRL